MQTLERFQGKGRAVLTASDATQYAFEGDDLRGSGTSSVFTRHLVEAIRSGAADLDEDGDIALDELYSYVHDRVVAEMPQQRPKKQEDVDGRILIARNVHWTLPDAPAARDREPDRRPAAERRRGARRTCTGSATTSSATTVAGRLDDAGGRRQPVGVHGGDGPARTRIRPGAVRRLSPAGRPLAPAPPPVRAAGPRRRPPAQAAPAPAPRAGAGRRSRARPHRGRTPEPSPSGPPVGPAVRRDPPSTATHRRAAVVRSCRLPCLVRGGGGPGSGCPVASSSRASTATGRSDRRVASSRRLLGGRWLPLSPGGRSHRSCGGGRPMDAWRSPRGLVLARC